MYDFLTDPNGSDGAGDLDQDSGYDDSELTGRSLHLPLRLLADPKKVTALAVKTELNQLTCRSSLRFSAIR